jgi:hypothetical protein
MSQMSLSFGSPACFACPNKRGSLSGLFLPIWPQVLGKELYVNPAALQGFDRPSRRGFFP